MFLFFYELFAEVLVVLELGWCFIYGFFYRRWFYLRFISELFVYVLASTSLLLNFLHQSVFRKHLEMFLQDRELFSKFSKIFVPLKVTQTKSPGDESDETY